MTFRTVTSESGGGSAKNPSGLSSHPLFAVEVQPSDHLARDALENLGPADRASRLQTHQDDLVAKGLRRQGDGGPCDREFVWLLAEVFAPRLGEVLAGVRKRWTALSSQRHPVGLVQIPWVWGVVAAAGYRHGGKVAAPQPAWLGTYVPVKAAKVLDWQT